MPSTLPIDLNTTYESDAPSATGRISTAKLDADHREIERWLNEDLVPALAKIIRDDDTLVDEIVRLRNLHPEVVEALEGLTVLEAADVCAPANVALSGLQTINGYTTIAGDRVLCIGQTNPLQNGPWVAAVGAWVRPSDFTSGSVTVARSVMDVLNGDLSGSSWMLSASVTVDSGSQSWVQISGIGTVVTIPRGGTGATTAPAARLALGITAAMDAVVTAADLAAGRLAFGGLIPSVATIAALKALAGTNLTGYVQVAGYLSAGDGGGGLFRWAAADATTDNGGTVIAPTAGGGRFLRVLSEGSVTAEQFGCVGDNIVNDHPALQAAITAAAAARLVLRLRGSKTYRITAPLVLGNYSLIAGDLAVINQVTVGQDALSISAVGNVWLDRVTVTLPVDAIGTGGAGLRIAGLSGWNKFEGCVFTGGRNCVAANGASCFTTTFEKCRFYTTYGSWVRWLDDATSTTISFRNCQGDGVSSTEHAYYFGPVTTGAGIEHLELTMCSADSVSRVAYLRSRYLVVNQFYAERLRGSDWANNFVAFEFGSNFEQPWVHGLKADFSTEVPAALTGLAIVSADGGSFRSCRFGSGFSNYAASTGAVVFRGSAGKTLYLETITNNTGCQYGVSAAVHVFGLADARNMALDPASGGTITRPNDLGGVRTAGTNSNSTGGAGVVFGTADYIVPSGTVSNGAFLAATFAYAAILPFGTGGGSNRKGGLRAFTNPSAAGTTTPVLSTEWEDNGDFRIDTSSWSARRLKLGSYFLWVDGSGRLRIKSSAPASDTDGTVVGTQV